MRSFTQVHILTLGLVLADVTARLAGATGAARWG